MPRGANVAEAAARLAAVGAQKVDETEYMRETERAGGYTKQYEQVTSQQSDRYETTPDGAKLSYKQDVLDQMTSPTSDGSYPEEPSSVPEPTMPADFRVHGEYESPSSEGRGYEDFSGRQEAYTDGYDQYGGTDIDSYQTGEYRYTNVDYRDSNIESGDSNIDYRDTDIDPRQYRDMNIDLKEQRDKNIVDDDASGKPYQYSEQYDSRTDYTSTDYRDTDVDDRQSGYLDSGTDIDQYQQQPDTTFDRMPQYGQAYMDDGRHETTSERSDGLSHASADEVFDTHLDANTTAYEEILEDGTVVRHKKIRSVSGLGVEAKDIAVTEKEGPVKEVKTVEESEDVLPDGTVHKKQLVRRHSIKQITRSVTIDEGDEEVTEEVVNVPDSDIVDVKDIQESEKVLDDGTVHKKQLVRRHSLKNITRSITSEDGDENIVNEEVIVPGTERTEIIETFDSPAELVVRKEKIEEVQPGGEVITKGIIVNKKVHKLKTRHVSFDSEHGQVEEEYEVEEVVPGTVSTFLDDTSSESSGEYSDINEEDYEDEEEDNVEVEDREEILNDGTIHHIHKVSHHTHKHTNSGTIQDGNVVTSSNLVETYEQPPQSETEHIQKPVRESDKAVNVAMNRQVHKLKTHEESFDSDRNVEDSGDYEVEEVIPGTVSAFIEGDDTDSEDDILDELKIDTEEVERTLDDGSVSISRLSTSSEKRTVRSRSGSIDESTDSRVTTESFEPQPTGEPRKTVHTSVRQTHIEESLESLPSYGSSVDQPDWRELEETGLNKRTVSKVTYTPSKPGAYDNYPTITVTEDFSVPYEGDFASYYGIKTDAYNAEAEHTHRKEEGKTIEYDFSSEKIQEKVDDTMVQEREDREFRSIPITTQHSETFQTSIQTNLSDSISSRQTYSEQITEEHVVEKQSVSYETQNRQFSSQSMSSRSGQFHEPDDIQIQLHMDQEPDTETFQPEELLVSETKTVTEIYDDKEEMRDSQTEISESQITTKICDNLQDLFAKEVITTSASADIVEAVERDQDAELSEEDWEVMSRGELNDEELQAAEDENLMSVQDLSKEEGEKFNEENIEQQFEEPSFLSQESLKEESVQEVFSKEPKSFEERLTETRALEEIEDYDKHKTQTDFQQEELFEGTIHTETKHEKSLDEEQLQIPLDEQLQKSSDEEEFQKSLNKEHLQSPLNEKQIFVEVKKYPVAEEEEQLKRSLDDHFQESVEEMELPKPSDEEDQKPQEGEVQKDLDERQLQELLDQEESRKSLDEEGIEEPLSEGEPQKSLVEEQELQKSSNEAQLRESFAEEKLTKTLDQEEMEKPVDEEKLQIFSDEVLLQKSSDEIELQKELLKATYEEQLVEKELHISVDEEKGQQSPEGTKLQKSLGEESLDEEPLRPFLSEVELKKSLDKEEVQKSLDEESLQKSGQVELQKSFDEDGQQKSADEESLQQSLKQVELQKSLNEEDLQKSLDEDSLQKSLDQVELQKSLDEDSQKYLDKELQRSVDEQIQQSLDEAEQKSLDEESLQHSLDEVELQKSLDEEEIQKSLDEKSLQQSGEVELPKSLDEEELQKSQQQSGQVELLKSFDEERLQQPGQVEFQKSLDEGGLQKSLDEEWLQPSIGQVELQKSFDDEELQKPFDEEKLQKSADEESLQQSGQVELQKFLDKEELQKSLEEESLQQSLKQVELHKSLDEEEEQKSLDEEEEQKSLDYDQFQESLEKADSQKYFDEELKRSIDEQIQQSLDETDQKSLDEESLQHSLDQVALQKYYEEELQKSLDEQSLQQSGQVEIPKSLDEEELQTSLDEEKLQQPDGVELPKSLDEEEPQKSLDEESLQQSLDQVELQKSMDEELQKSLDEESLQKSGQVELQKSLDEEELQKSLDEQSLQQSDQVEIPKSFDEEELQTSLDEEKLHQPDGIELPKSLDEEELQKSLDEESLQQSLDQVELQKSMDEELQKSLGEESLQQSSQVELQKSLDEEELQKSLDEESLQQSGQVELRKSLDEEELQTSLDEESLQQSDQVELQKSLDEEELQKSLDQEELQKSLDQKELQKSLDQVELQNALGEEELQKSLDEEQFQESLEKSYSRKSLDEELQRPVDEQIQQSVDVVGGLQISLDEEPSQQSLAGKDLQKPLGDEEQKKSLDEEQLHQTLGKTELRKSLDEELHKSLEERLEQSSEEAELQKSLDEEKQKKILDEEHLQESFEETKLQKSVDEEELQKSLDEELFQQSLDEVKLQKSVDEDMQQSLDKVELQKYLDEEMLQPSLGEEELQKSLSEEESKKLLHEVEIQKSLDKEELQISVEEDQIQKPLDDEHVSETMEEQIQSAVTEDVLQQEIPRESFEEKLQEEQFQKSFEEEAFSEPKFTDEGVLPTSLPDQEELKSSSEEEHTKSEDYKGDIQRPEISETKYSDGYDEEANTDLQAVEYFDKEEDEDGFSEHGVETITETATEGGFEEFQKEEFLKTNEKLEHESLVIDEYDQETPFDRNKYEEKCELKDDFVEDAYEEELLEECQKLEIEQVEEQKSYDDKQEILQLYRQELESKEKDEAQEPELEDQQKKIQEPIESIEKPTEITRDEKTSTEILEKEGKEHIHKQMADLWVAKDAEYYDEKKETPDVLWKEEQKQFVEEMQPVDQRYERDTFEDYEKKEQSEVATTPEELYGGTTEQENLYELEAFDQSSADEQIIAETDFCTAKEVDLPVKLIETEIIESDGDKIYPQEEIKKSEELFFEARSEENDFEEYEKPEATEEDIQTPEQLYGEPDEKQNLFELEAHDESSGDEQINETGKQEEYLLKVTEKSYSSDQVSGILEDEQRVDHVDDQTPITTDQDIKDEDEQGKADQKIGIESDDNSMIEREEFEQMEAEIEREIELESRREEEKQKERVFDQLEEEEAVTRKEDFIEALRQESEIGDELSSGDLSPENVEEMQEDYLTEKFKRLSYDQAMDAENVEDDESEKSESNEKITLRSQMVTDLDAEDYPLEDSKPDEAEIKISEEPKEELENIKDSDNIETLVEQTTSLEEKQIIYSEENFEQHKFIQREMDKLSEEEKKDHFDQQEKEEHVEDEQYIAYQEKSQHESDEDLEISEESVESDDGYSIEKEIEQMGIAGDTTQKEPTDTMHPERAESSEREAPLMAFSESEKSTSENIEEKPVLKESIEEKQEFELVEEKETQEYFEQELEESPTSKEIESTDRFRTESFEITNEIKKECVFELEHQNKVECVPEAVDEPSDIERKITTETQEKESSAPILEMESSIDRAEYFTEEERQVDIRQSIDEQEEVSSEEEPQEEETVYTDRREEFIEEALDTVDVSGKAQFDDRDGSSYITTYETTNQPFSSEYTSTTSQLNVARNFYATSSTEVQDGSLSPSDLGSQDGQDILNNIDHRIDAEDIDNERDFGVEGRISSDTSQQIFIEQHIQSDIHTDTYSDEESDASQLEDRPPSPSEFTLITSQDPETLTKHLDLNKYGSHSDSNNELSPALDQALITSQDSAELDRALADDEDYDSDQELGAEELEQDQYHQAMVASQDPEMLAKALGVNQSQEIPDVMTASHDPEALAKAFGQEYPEETNKQYFEQLEVPPSPSDFTLIASADQDALNRSLGISDADEIVDTASAHKTDYESEFVRRQIDDLLGSPYDLSKSSEVAMMQGNDQSVDNTMSALSSDNGYRQELIENDYQQEEELDEVPGPMVSSYEKLYDGVHVEPETQSDATDQTQLDIGDRFDSGQPDLHLQQLGKSSSYERLYEKDGKFEKEDKQGSQIKQEERSTSSGSEVAQLDEVAVEEDAAICETQKEKTEETDVEDQFSPVSKTSSVMDGLTLDSQRDAFTVSDHSTETDTKLGTDPCASLITTEPIEPTVVEVKDSGDFLQDKVEVFDTIPEDIEKVSEYSTAICQEEPEVVITATEFTTDIVPEEAKEVLEDPDDIVDVSQTQSAGILTETQVEEIRQFEEEVNEFQDQPVHIDSVQEGNHESMIQEVIRGEPTEFMSKDLTEEPTFESVDEIKPLDVVQDEGVDTIKERSSPGLLYTAAEEMQVEEGTIETTQEFVSLEEPPFIKTQTIECEKETKAHIPETLDVELAEEVLCSRPQLLKQDTREISPEDLEEKPLSLDFPEDVETKKKLLELEQEEIEPRLSEMECLESDTSDYDNKPVGEVNLGKVEIFEIYDEDDAKAPGKEPAIQEEPVEFGEEQIVLSGSESEDQLQGTSSEDSSDKEIEVFDDTTGAYVRIPWEIAHQFKRQYSESYSEQEKKSSFQSVKSIDMGSFYRRDRNVDDSTPDMEFEQDDTVDPDRSHVRQRVTFQLSEPSTNISETYESDEIETTRDESSEQNVLFDDLGVQEPHEAITDAHTETVLSTIIESRQHVKEEITIEESDFESPFFSPSREIADVPIDSASGLAYSDYDEVGASDMMLSYATAHSSLDSSLVHTADSMYSSIDRESVVSRESRMAHQELLEEMGDEKDRSISPSAEVELLQPTLESHEEIHEEDFEDQEDNQPKFPMAVHALGKSLADNEIYESSETERDSTEEKLSPIEEAPVMGIVTEGSDDPASKQGEKKVTFQSDTLFARSQELHSEDIKTSTSSSEMSMEPTLLAASYDLDTGNVSRVVAAFDLSPDTIEKQIVPGATAKTILSSPEDDVFETEGPVASDQEEMTVTLTETSDQQKQEDEELSSPFEMMSPSELFDDTQMEESCFTEINAEDVVTDDFPQSSKECLLNGPTEVEYAAEYDQEYMEEEQIQDEPRMDETYAIVDDKAEGDDELPIPKSDCAEKENLLEAPCALNLTASEQTLYGFDMPTEETATQSPEKETQKTDVDMDSDLTQPPTEGTFKTDETFSHDDTNQFMVVPTDKHELATPEDLADDKYDLRSEELYHGKKALSLEMKDDYFGEREMEEPDFKDDEPEEELIALDENKPEEVDEEGSVKSDSLEVGSEEEDDIERPISPTPDAQRPLIYTDVSASQTPEVTKTPDMNAEGLEKAACDLVENILQEVKHKVQSPDQDEPERICKLSEEKIKGYEETPHAFQKVEHDAEEAEHDIEEVQKYADDQLIDEDDQRTESDFYKYVGDPRMPPPVPVRSRLSQQISEDIPEITVTQHMHEELDEGDFSQMYAESAKTIECVPEEEDEEDLVPDVIPSRDKFDNRDGYGVDTMDDEYEAGDRQLLDLSEKPDIFPIEEDVNKEITTEQDHFLAEGGLGCVPATLEFSDDKDVGSDSGSVTPEEEFFQFEPDETIEGEHDAGEILSPEEHGDSSSVDSFATVVPAYVEEEDEDEYCDGEHEDRLADIASMTSSVHSDFQPSHASDTEQETIMAQTSDQTPKWEEQKEAEEEREDVESPIDDNRYEFVDSRQALSVITEISDEERFELVDKYDIESELGSDFRHSPDRVTQSPGVTTTGRFFGKSGERDDVSVTSSLLEFERLEREFSRSGSLNSIDNVDRESIPGTGSLPGSVDEKRFYGRSVDKDDGSTTSSLAEFERLEKQTANSGSGSSVDKVTPESKSSGNDGSMSSLSEFERLEQVCQEEDRRSSVESSSRRSEASSLASLAEFETIESEIVATEELEAEARKIVDILESGTLFDSQSFNLDKDSLDGRDSIERDSLSDGEQHHFGDGDSLDGDTSEMTDMTSSVIYAGNEPNAQALDNDSVHGDIGIMQISTDSLTLEQRSEHSRQESGPFDVDSLHDQDGIMERSADSLYGVVMQTSADSLDFNNLMQRSVDSTNDTSHIQPSRATGSQDSLQDMQRSADSLELNATKSDKDALQGGDDVMKTSADSLEIQVDQRNIMLMSVESAAWSSVGSDGMVKSSSHSDSSLMTVSNESDGCKEKSAKSEVQETIYEEHATETHFSKTSKSTKSKSSFQESAAPTKKLKAEPFKFGFTEEDIVQPFSASIPYEETKKVYTMVEWEEMKRKKKEAMEKTNLVSQPEQIKTTETTLKTHAPSVSHAAVDKYDTRADRGDDFEEDYEDSDPEHQGGGYAMGGDNTDDKSTTLLLKKEIHSRTVLGRHGEEETFVLEDTQIQQDQDPPEELKESMQQIINQFMDTQPQSEELETPKYLEDDV